MTWQRTIVTVALIGAAVTAMFLQCYGFTFLFGLGAACVWGTIQ